jgi:hypothetical protein
MRLTKRKKQIRRLLTRAGVAGIATLNELRVLAFNEEREAGTAGDYANHKRSFTRTLTSHMDPFDVWELSRTYRGIPQIVTTGILARWAIWDLIERRLLTSMPSADTIEFCMGSDACTVLFRYASRGYITIGTTVRYRSLYLVGEHLEEGRVALLSEVPWRIQGAAKGSERMTVVQGEKPVWELGHLPTLATLMDGTHISTAKTIVPH